jgi:hypothetical protein
MSEETVTIFRSQVNSALPVNMTQAEETSAPLRLEQPAGMTNDELVARVKAGFRKIAEEIPYILELRTRFGRLKRGHANIGGCNTWKEFCEKHLHRTDRRIRQVVAANSLVDKGKRLGLPDNVKKREAGTTPPKAASNWDALEMSKRCFGYIVNCLEHLSVGEANQALSDLIAKLQDERRMRIDPQPSRTKSNNVRKPNKRQRKGAN